MEGTEFEGAPLPLRLRGYTRLLTEGWAAYIETLLPAFFGNAYTPTRQADLMLHGLAIGAGRWARNPSSNPPRGLSTKKLIEQSRQRHRDQRDFVVLDLIDLLANSAQGACKDIGSDLGYEDDVRSMIVPLQLSGMRAGAAQAFASLFPPSTTLETLDALLRENMPADVTWWELDPVT